MTGFLTTLKNIFTCWGRLGSSRRGRSGTQANMNINGGEQNDKDFYSNNNGLTQRPVSPTDPNKSPTDDDQELDDNGFYILPAIIYFIITGCLTGALMWFIMTKYLGLFGITLQSSLVYTTMAITGFVVGALSGALLHVRAFVMLSIPMILSARGRAILLAMCLALTIAGPMQESITNAKSGANVIRCLATGAQRTAVRGFEAQVDVINGTISQYNSNVWPGWNKPKKQVDPEEEDNPWKRFIKEQVNKTFVMVNMTKTSEAIERRFNVTKGQADAFRDEVQMKFDTMNSYVKSAVQICAMVPLLTLVWQLAASANYLFRYLSRDAFDNVYITRDLRMLDQKNRMFVARHPKVIEQRGPYEALPVFPLRRQERREHIDLRACRITRTELRSIGRSIFTIAPYLLFFIVACLLTAGSYFVIVIIRDAAVNSFVGGGGDIPPPRNCTAEAALGANSTLWRELAPDFSGNPVLVSTISGKIVSAQCRTDELMKGLLRECTGMLMTACDDEDKLKSMTSFGKSKTFNLLKKATNTSHINGTNDTSITSTTTTAAPETNLLGSTQNNTTRKCVSNPYALRSPDLENIILIATIFLVIIIACLCNGFTLRLRRVICKFYYPGRERRRTRYLFRKLKLNRKIEAEKLKIAAFQNLEELKLKAKRDDAYDMEPAYGKSSTLRSQASVGTFDAGVGYDFDPERGGAYSSDDNSDLEGNIYSTGSSKRIIRPKKCLACRNKRKLFQFRRKTTGKHAAIKNKLIMNHSSAGGLFSTRVFHCTTKTCAGTFCQKCIDRMAYVCPFCERKFTESVVNRNNTIGPIPMSSTTTSFGNNPPPRRSGGPAPLPPGPPPPRTRQFQRQESTPSERHRHNAFTNLGMAESESNLEMHAAQPRSMAHIAECHQMSESASNLPRRSLGFDEIHAGVHHQNYDEPKHQGMNSQSTPDVLLVQSRNIPNENGDKNESSVGENRLGKLRLPPPPPPQNPGWKREFIAREKAVVPVMTEKRRKSFDDETIDGENDPIYEEPPAHVVNGKKVGSPNINAKPVVPPRLQSNQLNKMAAAKDREPGGAASLRRMT